MARQFLNQIGPAQLDYPTTENPPSLPPAGVAPRFMTDNQVRTYFGLTERALLRCRAMRGFPPRDIITNRTDSKLVDRFFDRMSGLESPSFGGATAASTKERF